MMEIIRKLKDLISNVWIGIMIILAAVPFFFGILIEWFIDSIKNGRKIKKILVKLPGELSSEEKNFLLRDIDFELEQFYEEEAFLTNINQNLYYRLNKTRVRLENSQLSRIDIQLLNYLYGKEELENIPYKVMGNFAFTLKEPYLSIVKLRVGQHFFMRHYIEMVSDNEIKINDWQREKEDLLDLLTFINKYGEINEIDLTFPYDEFGFDKIIIKNDEMIGKINNKEIGVLDYSEGYLNSLNIDENEKRKMKMENEIYIPLMNEFMKQEYSWQDKKYLGKEKNVLLENGEWANACSQCVFRTRQLSNNGCFECKPKKINKIHQ